MEHNSSKCTRRGFIRLGAVGAVVELSGGALARYAQAAEGERTMGKIRFSAMVTMGDWAGGLGVWGEPGVYYILKHLKDAGFSRVYWRTTDGCGQACYPSRVTNAAQQFIRDPVRFPEQHYIEGLMALTRPTSSEYLQSPVDFSAFDSVRAARDWARRFGLEFYCWHEHAEDHGSVGQIGRMGLEHPEWFTRNRDGQISHCRFSWAIEPAIEYRLAWVREVLAYAPDGIFFDFVKSMVGTPGIGLEPHFDENGVWYCTYDEPAVTEFKRRTGRDPFAIPNCDEEWVRFRAGYVTEFLRRVRALQREEFPNVKIGVFGCPTGREGLTVGDKTIPLADPLRAYLEDHDTWTREGLLDEFVNAYAGGRDMRQPTRIQTMVDDSRSRVHAPCRYLGTQMEVYGLRDEAGMLQHARAIADAGCEEVVFFESTPLESNRTWEAAKKVIERLG